jgi:transposase
MDNLPAHRVASVSRRRSRLRFATLLYLPPYSPDLNPVELAFSKLKADLRQAAEHAIPGLLRRIGRVVRATPKNAGISFATPAMSKRDRNPLIFDSCEGGLGVSPCNC